MDTRARDALVRGRSSIRFTDLPPSTQGKYREIAKLFPGEVVYACGSRVTGEYIDNGDPRIASLRKSVGKTIRRDSDYDFIVRTGAIPVGPIPSWADRLPDHTPQLMMVAVSMDSGCGSCGR